MAKASLDALSSKLDDSFFVKAFKELSETRNLSLSKVLEGADPSSFVIEQLKEIAASETQLEDLVSSGDHEDLDLKDLRDTIAIKKEGLRFIFNSGFSTTKTLDDITSRLFVVDTTKDHIARIFKELEVDASEFLVKQFSSLYFSETLNFFNAEDVCKAVITFTERQNTEVERFITALSHLFGEELAQEGIALLAHQAAEEHPGAAAAAAASAALPDDDNTIIGEVEGMEADTLG